MHFAFKLRLSKTFNLVLYRHIISWI